MGRNKYLKPRPLTPAQQGYFIALAYPEFRITDSRNELRCVGVLQPSVTSDRYTIQLEYAVPERPRVTVLQPTLRLAAGRTKLPHVFDGKELCLHLSTDWNPELRISEFVMPWISLWLIFYETWLVTGEWLGGGHEPTRGNDR